VRPTPHSCVPACGLFDWSCHKIHTDLHPRSPPKGTLAPASQKGTPDVKSETASMDLTGEEEAPHAEVKALAGKPPASSSKVDSSDAPPAKKSRETKEKA
jgi:hypothetical protein